MKYASSLTCTLATAVCLAVLLASGPEVARAAPLELAPLPEVDLATYDPDIRAVFQSARARVNELASADSVDEAKLAEAYGDLGRAALFYQQGELARASLQNAVALEPNTFRWHYHLGAQDHDQRRLPEARAELERALELEPGDGAALIRLGRVLLLLGEPDLAAREFESARANKPFAAAALYGLGRSAAARGESENAMRFFEQALELQPEAAEVHQQLGIAYRDAGKLDAAREHMAAVTGTTLSFPDPLVEALRQDFASSAAFLGMAAQNDGRFAEAARQFRKAVENDPVNSAYRQALAGVLAASGDQEGAITELQQAVRLDPESPMARVSLGRALAERDGFTPEVAAQFEAALEVAPEFEEARVGLAQTLAKLGRFSEAAAELLLAIEANPTNAEIRLLQGEVLLILNRNQEALTHLERAIESLADRPQALVAYGIALSRMRDEQAAGEVLRKVIEGDADSRQKSLAHLELAGSLDRLGDPATALLHYRSAADLLPEYKPPQLGLARALSRVGRNAEAADVYALVLLIDPEDLEALQERGWSLSAAGHSEEAVAELAEARARTTDATARAEIGLSLAALQQAAGRTSEATRVLMELVEESPELKDAHFNLALALGRQGEGEAAIRHLERVVELDPDDIEARLVLAQVWASNRRFAEARSTLEVAHRRLPESLPLTRALTHLLVASPDRGVRDPAAAVPLAMSLYKAEPRAEHAALVAAALAGSQRLMEAVEWQTRAIAEAEFEKLPERQRELMRRDLARYREGA